MFLRKRQPLRGAMSKKKSATVLVEEMGTRSVPFQTLLFYVVIDLSRLKLIQLRARVISPGRSAKSKDVVLATFSVESNPL